MTHLLPGGSYKYSFIAIIVTYDLLICNKNEKGSDFSLPLNLAKAAVDCKPRYASGSLGMRPATLLSSLMLAISGLGLHHPRVGSRPIWTLVKKIKMTSKWMSFYFMAEDMGLE